MTEDPRLSFDKVPAIYDLSRPTYPDDAFDCLFDFVREARPHIQVDALEIGPGTGQATQGLLSHGALVTAVEIGPNLADFLRQKYHGEERLRVITGAFEDVELPPHRFDLVFAATSFHWIERSSRLGKIHDLLRSAGTIAILSTVQIQSDVDLGYFARTFPIYKRWRPGEQQREMPTEDGIVVNEYVELAGSRLYGDARRVQFRWDQVYSADAYEQLVRSYSDTQMMEAVAREGLIADLKAIIEQEYNGRVVRPLVITLTLARSIPT
jgi:SAM-dependent methyltransferase